MANTECKHYYYDEENGFNRCSFHDCILDERWFSCYGCEEYEIEEEDEE